MRLVSFTIAGKPSFGCISEAGIIDLGLLLPDIADLKSLFAANAVPRAEALADRTPDYRLADVTLLPVIPNPGKIICVGGNFAAHILESGRELPEYPMLFPRFAASQVGAGQPILVPPESHKLDFEGELALVIGKGGRRIPGAAALEHIAGFTCFNDGSIRDWQRHSSQFMPGKNFAATGASGPWLVTTDAMPPLAEQTMITRLDGVEVQTARFDDMIFDIPYLVNYCSTFIPLEPGDVIVTGTPHGVGAYRTPPLWMRPGSVVEIEISGIGVLTNPVAAEIA